MARRDNDHACNANRKVTSESYRGDLVVVIATDSYCTVCGAHMGTTTRQQIRK